MHDIVKTWRMAAVAALSLALSGCGASVETGGFGAISVAVTAADVASVSVAVSGPGISTPITAAFTPGGGEWTGTVANVPAGTDRSVTAEGRDAGGTLVYQGAATGVTVEEGATASVVIVMQEVNPPPPYGNTAPVIDSVFASNLSPGTGETISVAVRAHDADAGSLLGYAWTATAGTFTPAAANVPSPQWTAPSSGGEQTLTVRVTDEKGLSATASFTIRVVTPGALDVSVTANTWPVVTAMTATPSRMQVGEPVALAAVASDADGDALTIAWSSDCAGTFDGVTGPSSSFTPSAVPVGNLCVVTATAADGRQGTATGSVGIWVGLPAPETTTLPPPGPLGLVPGQLASVVENSVPDQGGGLGTVRVSLPSPSTAGNLVLVVASQNTRTSPVAVSDDAGNTTAAGNYLTSALATAMMGSTYSVQAFWLPTCNAGVQHIDVQTSAYQHLMVVAAEFSGVARVADPFDQGFTDDVYASGDGALVTVGPTPVTPYAPELIVAAVRSVPTPGLSYTAGDGFTLIGPSLAASDDDAFAVEYGIATATGTRKASFVQHLASGGATHHAFVLAFRGE